jgi:hypothetical protein
VGSARPTVIAVDVSTALSEFERKTAGTAILQSVEVALQGSELVSNTSDRREDATTAPICEEARCWLLTCKFGGTRRFRQILKVSTLT